MEEEAKIRKSERPTAYCNLSEFCPYANENDTIEVTDWTNGDGYDIQIIRPDDKEGDLKIELTYGELDAIKALVAMLDGEEKVEPEKPTKMGNIEKQFLAEAISGMLKRKDLDKEMQFMSNAVSKFLKQNGLIV